MRRIFIFSLILNVILIAAFIGLYFYLPDRFQNEAETVSEKLQQRKLSVIYSLENSKQDIVFIGGSQLADIQWAELLRNPQVKNRSIAGSSLEDTGQWLDSLVKGPVRKAFLYLGAPEIIKAQDPDKVIAKYQQIIKKLKSKNAQMEVYLMSLLPVPELPNAKSLNEAIIVFNSKIKELAENQKINFVPLYEAFLDNKEKPGLRAEYAYPTGQLTTLAYLRWSALLQQYL